MQPRDANGKILKYSDFLVSKNNSNASYQFLYEIMSFLSWI